MKPMQISNFKFQIYFVSDAFGPSPAAGCLMLTFAFSIGRAGRGR